MTIEVLNGNNRPVPVGELFREFGKLLWFGLALPVLTFTGCLLWPAFALVIGIGQIIFYNDDHGVALGYLIGGIVGVALAVFLYTSYQVGLYDLSFWVGATFYSAGFITTALVVIATIGFVAKK